MHKNTRREHTGSYFLAALPMPNGWPESSNCSLVNVLRQGSEMCTIPRLRSQWSVGNDTLLNQVIDPFTFVAEHLFQYFTAVLAQTRGRVPGQFRCSG